MVVAGDWEIDENGVVGGERKWMVADIEQEADHFQVKLLCIPPERDDYNAGNDRNQ